MKKKLKIYLAMFLMGIPFFCHSQLIGVQIHSVEGEYVQYPELVDSVKVELEIILNSKEFREAIINGDFYQKNGLTNKQLLDTILLAREKEGPKGQDRILDIRLRTLTPLEKNGKYWMRRCKSNTVGMDDSETGIVATCREKVVEWGKSGVDDSAIFVNVAAGHIMHEYMHQLGFSHRWPRKYASAVYKIGDLVTQLAFDRRRDKAIVALLAQNFDKAKPILEKIAQWEDENAETYKKILQNTPPANEGEWIKCYQKILEDKRLNKEIHDALVKSIQTYNNSQH